MVGGESFAVDASLIKADANRRKGIESEKWLAPKATGQAIDEYLALLHDAAFGAATEVTPRFISPADRRRAGPTPMARGDEFHLAATAQNLRKLAKVDTDPEPKAA